MVYIYLAQAVALWNVWIYWSKCVIVEMDFETLLLSMRGDQVCSYLPLDENVKLSTPHALCMPGLAMFLP